MKGRRAMGCRKRRDEERSDDGCVVGGNAPRLELRDVVSCVVGRAGQGGLAREVGCGGQCEPSCGARGGGRVVVSGGDGRAEPRGGVA